MANLGYPDGELVDSDTFRGTLVQRVRRLRPDVVCGHDPTALFFGQEYFNHRDHRIAGTALLDAVSPAAALPLYFPDAGPPHQVATVLLSGTLEPDEWVDVSETHRTARRRRSNAIGPSSPSPAGGPARRCGAGPRRRVDGPVLASPRASAA